MKLAFFLTLLGVTLQGAPALAGQDDDQLVKDLPAGTVITMKAGVDLNRCADHTGTATITFQNSENPKCSFQSFFLGPEVTLFNIDPKKLNGRSLRCTIKSVHSHDDEDKSRITFEFNEPECGGANQDEKGIGMAMHRAFYDPRGATETLADLKETLGPSFTVSVPNQNYATSSGTKISKLDAKAIHHYSLLL